MRTDEARPFDQRSSVASFNNDARNAFVIAGLNNTFTELRCPPGQLIDAIEGFLGSRDPRDHVAIFTPTDDRNDSICGSGVGARLERAWVISAGMTRLMIVFMSAYLSCAASISGQPNASQIGNVGTAEPVLHSL
ncbi:hypothetical protein ACE103_25505 [Bradyrhizobium sp. ma5]|uniref:hypothetical protein n=1 Tax=Bradyrhizobium sp. ma5 TaxID=3344828 RepID=UPI0035D3DA10